MTTTAAPRLRSSLVGQALASGALGAALLGLAWADHRALLAGIAVVQLLSVLGFLAVADAPAAEGVFALGVAAALAADLVVVLDDGRARYLAPVVALSLVAGMGIQLFRRERSRVTEALADTLVVVTLAAAAAGLAAANWNDSGTWPTRAALAAAAAALLLGRLADVVLPRPALTPTRAWPGLVLALAAGTAAATVTAHDHESKAPLIGLAAAAAVVAVDLLLDLARTEVTTDARRAAALRPTRLFVPFALLGPVVLTAVRLLAR